VSRGASPDAVLRLAGPGIGAKSELDFVSGGKYTASAVTFDGKTPFTDVDYDGANDGVIMTTNCPANPGYSCVLGVYYFMHLSNGQDSMDELVLVATNLG